MPVRADRTKTHRRLDDSDKALGRELAARRNAVRLTQQRVATRLGVSVRQYAKYERGQSRLSANRYEEILAIFREHSRGSGFEESQMPYEPARPDKETLLQHLGGFESDLKSCLERLRVYRDLVERM